MVQQVNCWHNLSGLFCTDSQLVTAEAAGYQSIEFFPVKGHEFLLCQAHKVLGVVYIDEGERAKAKHHLKTALRIASAFEWHSEQFWTDCALVHLFSTGNNFDGANTHIE
jgi:hypothetical protein